jgi:4-aminobutyrate aminotransferase/(S)-3-amino-2-methylpropionate transaminase
MDSVGAGGLGGTYGGNPTAVAAALGAIEAYENDGLLERAVQIGEIIVRRVEALQAKHPEIGHARGRGAMQAIELALDYYGSGPTHPHHQHTQDAPTVLQCG